MCLAESSLLCSTQNDTCASPAQERVLWDSFTNFLSQFSSKGEVLSSNSPRLNFGATSSHQHHNHLLSSTDNNQFSSHQSLLCLAHAHEKKKKDTNVKDIYSLVLPEKNSKSSISFEQQRTGAASVLLPLHNVRYDPPSFQPLVYLAACNSTCRSDQFCGLHFSDSEANFLPTLESKSFFAPSAFTLYPIFSNSKTEISLPETGKKRSHSCSVPTFSVKPIAPISKTPLDPGENEILVTFEVDSRRILVPVENFDEKVSSFRHKIENLGHSDQSQFRLFHGRDLVDEKTLSFYGIKGGDKVILKESSKFSRFHEKLFHWDKGRFGKRKQQGSTPLKSNELIGELSSLLEGAKKTKENSVFLSRYVPIKEIDMCVECKKVGDRCKLGKQKPCSQCGMSEYFMLNCPSTIETRKQILNVFLPLPSRLFHLVSSSYLRWLALGHKTITYLETLSVGLTGRIHGKSDVRLMCFSLRYKCPRQAKDIPNFSEDICFNVFAQFDFGKYFETLSNCDKDQRNEKKKFTNTEQKENMMRILEACDICENISPRVDKSKNFWVTDVWNQVITTDLKSRINVKETLRILFYDFCATCALDPSSFFLVVKIPKDEDMEAESHFSKRRRCGDL
jgi:hypothetical protein